MFPVFELWGKTFSAYQITALVGIFVAGIYACCTAKKRGLDEDDMIVFGLVGAVGVLVGGHVLYGLTNPGRLITFFTNLWNFSSFQDFFNAVLLVFGGSVFYGGLLGGIFSAVIYARKKQLPLPDFGDIAASAVPLFHFFGRVGCFLSGCCYGVESSFGLVYRHSLIPAANGVSRFPIQLAEACFNLLLFVLLYQLLKRRIWQGRLFFVYLQLYAAGRFCLEFGRGDTLRGIFFGLSTSQWISIPVLLASAVLFWKKGRSTPLATTNQ